MGAGAPAACGPVGGVGGGVAPRPPCSPSGWRPAVLNPGPTRVVSALLSGVRVRSGSRCRPGLGGLRGGLWTAPPGAPADLEAPSALPEWAVVTGGSCRARPPYCSGAPPCAAPKLGARVAPARWCGHALPPRPPREQAAGAAGARGVQVQPHPPPPRAAVPSGGGGASPRLRGAGGPLLWLPSWGGGGGGVGGPPPPPAPSGVGLPSVVSGVLPRGILVPWGLPGGRGRRARSGWPPTGQCGGGGGDPPPWFAPPSSLGRPQIGPLCLRRPGRRWSADGRQQAGRAGACLGRGAPAPRVQRPLREGCGAAVSSVCLRLLLGLSGRGGGGVGGGLWSPGAASCVRHYFLVHWLRSKTSQNGPSIQFLTTF